MEDEEDLEKLLDKEEEEKSEPPAPPEKKEEEAKAEESSTFDDDDEDKQFNLEFVYDVPMSITAELGNIDITIKNLLSIDKGTVIELDKLAGEPLEVLINNKLISKGEVIVVNEKYGVRMTDIVDPEEKNGGDTQTEN